MWGILVLFVAKQGSTETTPLYSAAASRKGSSAHPLATAVAISLSLWLAAGDASNTHATKVKGTDVRIAAANLEAIIIVRSCNWCVLIVSDRSNLNESLVKSVWESWETEERNLAISKAC
jgi:hypothetical protein